VLYLTGPSIHCVMLGEAGGRTQRAGRVLLQPAHETQKVEGVVVARRCDGSVSDGRETYNADVARLFSRLHALVLMLGGGTMALRRSRGTMRRKARATGDGG
jgi:hypothetical protein